MASKIVRMKLILCLLCGLLSINSGAQVAFDGIRPAVDNLTGKWLLPVTKSRYGKPYQASVTLDDNVISCRINGVEVKETGEYTFPIINPGSSYSLQIVSENVAVNAVLQFTYWPVIQIYGEDEFVKRPYEEASVTVTVPDSSYQENIKSRVRWAGSSTAEPDRLKHNFHLKFYNEDGSKKNMSFFGLRVISIGVWMPARLISRECVIVSPKTSGPRFPLPRIMPNKSLRLFATMCAANLSRYFSTTITWASTA